MLARIFHRTVISLLLVLGVSTLVFLLAHVLPGDPTTVYLSPRVPPSVAERLRAEFGLDKPLLIQYGHWLSGLARGELGFSYTHQREVLQVIGDALPYTVVLALAAILIEIVAGTFLALVASRFVHSVLDKLILRGGLLLYVTPHFWLAILLLSVFSFGLDLFPSSQVHSLGAEKFSMPAYGLDFLHHLFLPALVIGLPGAAGIARYLRSNLLTVLKEDYITAAKSMGVSGKRIYLSYALPNAFLPVLTIVGLELGTLLAGALVTETIFAWPGMGRLAVSAMFARDYPLLLGCTMVAGFAVIFANLAADVAYTMLDPRIRLES